MSTEDAKSNETPSNTPELHADRPSCQDVYSTYQEERKLLAASEFDYAKSFDKWLLVASGASLGLSISFISDIVPLKSAVFVSWLALGWLLLVASIACVLISLHVAQYAFQEYRDTMDTEAENCGFEDFWTRVRIRQARCWRPRALDWLNIGALSMFLLGLFLVVGFVIVNVAQTQGA